MRSDPEASEIRPARSAAGLAALALAVLLGACGDERPAPVRPPASGAEPDLGRDLDELSKLGYADFAEEATSEPSGVVEHDPERSSGGYTLVASVPHARADLLAIDGSVVRSWSDPEARLWSRAELDPDGRLLVIGTHTVTRADRDRSAEHARTATPYDGSFLACYAFEGELLWRRESIAHHDLDVTPWGEILVLSAVAREVRPGVRVIDELLAFHGPDGEPLRTLSLLDVLLEPQSGVKRVGAMLAQLAPREGPYDPLHANSVDWLPFPDLVGTHRRYAEASVLVSIRHVNTVVAVDVERRKVVWRFGPGELQLQHEATWLENGNVLVFDNGTVERGFSRVVEIDPGAGEVVWEYRARDPESFFCRGGGTTQPLPGGNVFVSDSENGELFEVTRSGDVVWRYRNVHASEGRLGRVRGTRYPAELVEPLLAR